MTDSTNRLSEIEARLDAATAGPWRACAWDVMERPHVTVPTAHGVVDLPRTPADADLIAHAPADLRYLLDRVRELEDQLDMA